MDNEGSSATDINITKIIIDFNGTSIIAYLNANNSASIASYSYKLEKLTYVLPGAPTYTSETIVDTTYISSFSFNVSGLSAGKTYKITARSYTGANGTGQTGDLISYDFVMPSSSKAGSIIETVKTIDSGTYVDPNSLINQTQDQFAPTGYTVPSTYVKTTKSLFKLSQPSQSNYSYTAAYKSFTQLDTTQSYYLFGTNMFFDASINKPIQSGGIAFFVSNDGMDGYYLELQTTAASAAVSSQKEFQIFRIKSGVKTPLTDTQIGTQRTLTGIYGGQTYKIDIKVSVESTKRTIIAYVNGFKITATDTSTSNLLAKTNNVAMICNKGDVYFDYIYGMHIGVDSYNQDSLINVYEGRYPKNLISFLYGERVDINDPDINPVNSGFIEEFGAVARELRVLKTKYESRPAFPLYASTGINTSVSIIGQRLSSAGAEVYVLNNSGTYIPLDDSQYYSFYILGKYISQSGEIEYVENGAGEYTSQEPITFTSSWIQKNSDVVSLANWIKNVWSKKQSILDISVFGNPLLSIGDIIVINYPYLEITASQKFLITDIQHSYTEGLETTIVCRTL